MTVGEQGKSTCDLAISYSCDVRSATSSASQARLATANMKGKCSHGWKPSRSDIAVDIACVTGLMTGPLAFNVSRAANAVVT